MNLGIASLSLLVLFLPSLAQGRETFSGRGTFQAKDGLNTDFELRFDVTPDGRALGTITLLDEEGNTSLPLAGDFRAGNVRLEWTDGKTEIRLEGARSGVSFRSGAGTLESPDLECRTSARLTGRDPDACDAHREIALWTADPGEGGPPTTGAGPDSSIHEPAEAGPTEAPECRFDNDCPNQCRGDVLQKRVCNARTNRCENGMVDDCSVLRTTIGVGVEARSRSMTCLALAEGAFCAPRDGALPSSDLGTNRRSVLQAEYQSLRKEYDSLTAQIQSLNDLYQASAATCVNGLAAFSLKNLVEIVGSFSGPPKNLVAGLAEGAAIIVNKLVDAANESRGVQPFGRPGTEIIAEACQLERDLKAAIPNRIRLRESLAVDIRRLAAELKD